MEVPGCCGHAGLFLIPSVAGDQCSANVRVSAKRYVPTPLGFPKQAGNAGKLAGNACMHPLLPPALRVPPTHSWLAWCRLAGWRAGWPSLAWPGKHALDPDCTGSLDVQLEIPLRLLAKTTLTRGRAEANAISPNSPSRRRVFIATLSLSTISPIYLTDRAGRAALSDASRGALSRIEVCQKIACHHGADAPSRRRRHRRVNVRCSRPSESRANGASSLFTLEMPFHRC